MRLQARQLRGKITAHQRRVLLQGTRLMAAISIFNRQHKIGMSKEFIESLKNRFVPAISAKLRLQGEACYNIVFVSSKRIKSLNKEYLKKSHATDVISFRYSSQAGDIYISPETALSNADYYGEDFVHEILRLIIHGILHARGYTDYTVKSRERMWGKQEEVLKCIV